MKLDKKKIKRIKISGGDDGRGFVQFELFKPLKMKKVSSTKSPSLLGYNNFLSKGGALLEFFNLAEKEAFDDFYTLRGEVAELLLVSILNAKGYKTERFDKEDYNYDYFPHDETNEGQLNKLYKYFGGLPDVVAKKDDKTTLFEVKSKDLDKMKYVVENAPQHEVWQGKHLGLLYGVDTVTMVWFFFGDDAIRNMYRAIENTVPFDLEKSVAEFGELHGKLKYKKDYDIYKHEYFIDKKWVLNNLKEAYKSADTFRQTLTINFKDIDKDLRSEIFRLEEELEGGKRKKNT